MIPGTPAIHSKFLSQRALLATLAAIALTVSLTTGQPAPAAAQDFPSTISGRIVQGTPGAEVPAGLSVVLLVVDEAQQQIVTTDDTLVGTNGEFTFTGFPTGPGLTYRVVADAGQFTPSVDLRPGEDSFDDVEVTVYEPTAAFDDIRISTYSMLVPSIDRVERRMGVLSVISIINSGQHVWVPPDINDPSQQVTGLDLLRFNLPEGFTDLSVESNLPPGNVMEISSGFAITNPVPPGEYDILMTYIANYSGDSLTFPMRLPYGADLVRIMLPEGEGTVTGQGLGAAEGAIIDETAYSLVTGAGYARDSELGVEFSSLPTPTFIERTQNFFEGRGYIIVIAWVVGAAILGLLVYAFFFAKQRGAASAQQDPLSRYPEYMGMERAEIVETIASLDKQHDAGEVEEEDYAARRAALTKAALTARVSEAQPT